jgi:glycosyltransferase involved in cell wall biosynthesis
VSKNLINGEDALIVPPANSGALADAIKTLLSNTELANRIARSGKSLSYEKFSAVRMVKEIIGIYDEFLRNRQKYNQA